VVSATPRPHFTPKKDLVPIVQVAGWAPAGLDWRKISPPHRDSIPADRPARSQSLNRLGYPAHDYNSTVSKSPSDLTDDTSMISNKNISIQIPTAVR
jgi:hypothetical protein